MKNNTYQNAVDHLEFSDDLYGRVLQNVNKTRKPVRLVRLLAIAAVVTALLATTALAVGSYIKDKIAINETPVPVQTLGTAEDRFENSKLMEFTVSQDMEGVKVHYMELDFSNGVTSYRFFESLLYGYTGYHDVYYRITEDYQMEPVQMQKTDAVLQKGELTYVFPYDYRYTITENGFISNYHGSRTVNENGEFLTHVYLQNDIRTLYPSDISWPVYLNAETGQIRDALPQFTPEDFPNQSVHARSWKGGLLIYLGISGGHRDLCWIVEGSTEPVQFTIPEDGVWIPASDTIYYQDEAGNHYRLDEDFKLQPAAPYNSYAMPGGGLLEVMTDEKKLGIYDLRTGDAYVFPEIGVNRGSFTGSDAYYTLRSVNGRIALLKKGRAFEPIREVLEQIGILDLESSQLKMLQIENGYAMTYCSWLNGDRLGVIYENGEHQYLCIYEFE